MHVLDDSPGSTLVRLPTNTPKAEPPPWSNEPRGGLESGDPIGSSSTDPKRGPATDARTDEMAHDLTKLFKQISQNIYEEDDTVNATVSGKKLLSNVILNHP